MFGPELAGRARDARLQETSTQVFALLADGIGGLQRAGRVRTGDVQAMALSAWALVHGLAMLALDGRAVPGDAAALERLGRTATELLMFGMAATGGGALGARHAHPAPRAPTTRPPVSLLSCASRSPPRMQNFFEQFAWAAERHAGRTAIEVQHKDHLDAFTYGRLREMAERTAAWLAVIGVGAGERCAILADNDAHWCAAYLGVLRRGAIAVPLDTAYKAAQVETLLRDSGARVFFTTAKYLDTVRAGRASAGNDCRIVLLHGQAEETASFEGMIGGHMPAPPLPACPSRLDDPAVILYTSGTTSDPKGVVLTHGNLLAERARRLRDRARGRARHDPGRAAAVPRARADGQPAAAIFDRRARGVSRDGEHHRAAARAGRAPGDDLRVRPAVLLSDPPAGDDPGRQVQSPRALALCGDAGAQRRHAQDRPEPGRRAVPPRPPRAGRPRARDGDRRVAVRSRHRRATCIGSGSTSCKATASPRRPARQR